jgi:hypothetical protein
MKRVIAAMVVVLTTADLAEAQVVFAPRCAVGFGGGFAYRSTFAFGGGFAYRSGFALGGPRVSVVFSRSFYAAPVFPAYYPFGPFAGPGWGPGYGNPYFLPPPPIVVGPPVIVVPPPVVIGGNIEPNRREPVVVQPDRGVPLRPDDYLVISPRKDVPALPANPPVADGVIVPKLDRVAEPVVAIRPPVFRFDPFAAQPVLGRNDTPEADPVAEAARQVKQARQAFANEEYGRVAEHLDRAIRVKPDDPVPYFLKAQARMAAGEYADAVASIRDGLKRAPNWPASGFNPRDFYGRDADRFDAHLAELRKAVAASPDAPTLQFLLAYHLWFTGDREAAVALLMKARKQVRDGNAIEAFLTEAAK